MPAGDDLTVVLFLWSSALAIGLYVLVVTGWKHHYLIPGLVVLAAVLILIGVAWVPVKEGPIAAIVMGMLTQAANSRWAWLAVGVLFGAVVWRSLPDMAQRFPLLRPVIDPRYISLHDAALRLYERISRGARTTDRVLTDQEVLRTYASIVLRYDLVRIFGGDHLHVSFGKFPRQTTSICSLVLMPPLCKGQSCRTSQSSPMLPFRPATIASMSPPCSWTLRNGQYTEGVDCDARTP